MSATKQQSKSHMDRLVVIEEQMVYLSEVLDRIGFLETWLQ